MNRLATATVAHADATWPSTAWWKRNKRFASWLTPGLVCAVQHVADQCATRLHGASVAVIVAVDQALCETVSVELADVLDHWDGGLSGLAAHLYEEISPFSYVRGLASVQGQFVAQALIEASGCVVASTLAHTSGDVTDLARRMIIYRRDHEPSIVVVVSADRTEASATVYGTEKCPAIRDGYIATTRVRAGTVQHGRAELFAGLPCCPAEALIDRAGADADTVTAELVAEALADVPTSRVGVVSAPMWPGAGGSNAETWLDQWRNASCDDTDRARAMIEQTIGREIVWHRIEATCAGGLRALIEASRMVASGDVDHAVAVGVVLRNNPYHLSQFAQLTALSTWQGDPADASRPFADDRAGMVLAEGAGAVLISATPGIARVAGWGMAVDPTHPTAPSSAYFAATMRQALGTSHPADVRRINAHGTGTPLNDAAELAGIRELWGSELPQIDAVKRRTGHASSASGLIEIAAAVQSGGRVLKNSCGFGGQYAAVLLDAC